MFKKVIHIWQLTMCTHKKNNVHVPYEKQQHTKKKIISLYFYLPIIPSLPVPTPTSNTHTHTHTHTHTLLYAIYAKVYCLEEKKEEKMLGGWVWGSEGAQWRFFEDKREVIPCRGVEGRKDAGTNSGKSGMMNLVAESISSRVKSMGVCVKLKSLWLHRDKMEQRAWYTYNR